MFPFYILQELNPELFSPEPPKDVGEVTEETQINRDELLPESLRGSATAVWNTIKDLHLELILMYHRVCLKLETMGPGKCLGGLGERVCKAVPWQSGTPLHLELILM